MSIEELVQSLAEDTITVETEVRTKVALPLFALLDWPEPCRAEEFPVYRYEGRNPLHPKPADILYFDNDVTLQHRRRVSADQA